jgi:hypothetical protein
MKLKYLFLISLAVLSQAIATNAQTSVPSIGGTDEERRASRYTSAVKLANPSSSYTLMTDNISHGLDFIVNREIEFRPGTFAGGNTAQNSTTATKLNLYKLNSGVTFASANASNVAVVDPGWYSNTFKGWEINQGATSWQPFIDLNFHDLDYFNSPYGVNGVNGIYGVNGIPDSARIILAPDSNGSTKYIVVAGGYNAQNKYIAKNTTATNGSVNFAAYYNVNLAQTYFPSETPDMTRDVNILQTRNGVGQPNYAFPLTSSTLPSPQTPNSSSFPATRNDAVDALAATFQLRGPDKIQNGSFKEGPANGAQSGVPSWILSNGAYYVINNSGSPAWRYINLPSSTQGKITQDITTGVYSGSTYRLSVLVNKNDLNYSSLPVSCRMNIQFLDNSNNIILQNSSGDASGLGPIVTGVQGVLSLDSVVCPLAATKIRVILSSPTASQLPGLNVLHVEDVSLRRNLR